MPPQNPHVLVADEITSSARFSRLMSYATLSRCVSEMSALASWLLLAYASGWSDAFRTWQLRHDVHNR
jgi:hypothetical protein